MRFGNALCLVSCVEALSDADEEVDQRRDEDDRKHDLCQHLAEEEFPDREDPIKGDGDEDQRIDNLAEAACNRRAEPETFKRVEMP